MRSIELLEPEAPPPPLSRSTAPGVPHPIGYLATEPEEEAPAAPKVWSDLSALTLSGQSRIR